MKIGEFSRGGYSRVTVHGQDHDFSDGEKVTPVGFYLPELDLLYIYLVKSKVTSDLIADCLEDVLKKVQQIHPKLKKLQLALDNGPENHSRRTQFMNRMVEFVENSQVDVDLTYYPPYHSKYNPIERVWGFLEQHWNGSLLDSLHAVVEFAKSLTFRGISPIVEVVDKVYETGVKLTKQEMKKVEEKIQRMPGLEKWFVTISSTFG